MTRSTEERDRDRADLLAALDDYGSAMPTQNLIAAAYGLYPSQVVPGLMPYRQGYNDLRFLERAGDVVSETGAGGWCTRWRRATADVDEVEDEREVERMMRGWEVAQ